MPFTTDTQTTVAQLSQLVDDFVTERDWHSFHAPKNLAMALAVEAAELMEHFQWMTTEASWDVRDDPAKLAEVGEEIADVFGYCVAIARELDIDLASTLQKKMIKNAQKYPIDASSSGASHEEVR